MLIIQRSQIAGFSFSAALAPGLDRPYIPSCAEHGAGVGRSSTGRSYEAARKGRSGKSTGAVDETATGSANFFGPSSPLPHRRIRLDYDRRDVADSSAAEHRPGRDRAHLGRRPRCLHLLRPDRDRRERRDRRRDRDGLVRRDLARRASARRGTALAAAVEAPPVAVAPAPTRRGEPVDAVRARRRACA